MNSRKLNTQYLSKRDYGKACLNNVEEIARDLEDIRRRLIDVRVKDGSNNESSRAILDVESALRYLDHYLNRREAAGIYTLDIGESTGVKVDEVATQAGFGRLILNYVQDSPNGATTSSVPFNSGRVVDLKYTIAYLAEYYNHHNIPLILWDPVIKEGDENNPREMSVNISHHPDQILGPTAFNTFLSNKYELFTESLKEDLSEEDLATFESNIGKAFVIKNIERPGEDIVIPFEGWVKDFFDAPAEDSAEGHQKRVRFSYLSLAISRLIANTFGIEQYQICGDQRIAGLYGLFVKPTLNDTGRVEHLGFTPTQVEELQNDIKELCKRYETMPTY